MHPAHNAELLQERDSLLAQLQGNYEELKTTTESMKENWMVYKQIRRIPKYPTK